MKIDFRNTQIHFDTQGKGNPLVLLHGFLESKKIWKDYMGVIAKYRQVVTIDLPGHGESGSFGEVHSMADMAKSVKAVLDEINIEKAALAGHSMGGYVILEFHNIFPTMTTGLALVNSTPEADSPERQENRDRATHLVRENKKAYVNMAIQNLLSKENINKFREEIEELKQQAQKMTAEGIIGALQGMKIRTNHNLLFTNFNKKKIILASKNDPILDYNEMKRIAFETKSELLSLPGGHLSFIEDKKELMKFVHFID